MKTKLDTAMDSLMLIAHRGYESPQGEGSNIVEAAMLLGHAQAHGLTKAHAQTVRSHLEVLQELWGDSASAGAYCPDMAEDAKNSRIEAWSMIHSVARLFIPDPAEAYIYNARDFVIMFVSETALPKYSVRRLLVFFRDAPVGTVEYPVTYPALREEGDVSVHVYWPAFTVVEPQAVQETIHKSTASTLEEALVWLVDMHRGAQ